MAAKHDTVFRINPYYFLHVLDNNTNITRVEIGPKTFICKDHETVVLPVTPMISIPPQHYCEIINPITYTLDGDILFDKSGAAKLKFGHSEIRLTQNPFPLYPGEYLKSSVQPLKIVQSNNALKLRALEDIEEDGLRAVAGDEWLFKGPGVYIPNHKVEIVDEVKPQVILINQALKVRATNEFIDQTGCKRVTGDEWLITKQGCYIPNVYEEVVGHVDGIVLTEKTALHLRAVKGFVDCYGIKRKCGQEWLVTVKQAAVHIVGVNEEIVEKKEIITVTNRQYCVIVNPVDEKGRPQLGARRLVKGAVSFFLMPGEKLENGIQNIFVLGPNEGLILRANEVYKDGNLTRKPGDRWLVRGPTEMIPAIEVDLECKREAIVLGKNEGIYVRDINSGAVRSVIGSNYLLTENEELWEKELPDNVENLLADKRVCVEFCPMQSLTTQSEKQILQWIGAKRDKTRVVTLQVPHNGAVQIYDYKLRSARVQFGPDLVMLGPDEQFTQLSLSGGKPKQPNQIKSLTLLLGPDFSSDILTVETADHARLSLKVSYNWHFMTLDKSQEVGLKLFSVPDFVGDICKAMASRIRGKVASVKFDDFHKDSAQIIQASVFGMNESGKINNKYVSKSNNLVVTSVDIQSVNPVDEKTKDSLQKSVQMAIEITTKSQEAAARHEADRLEQQARGKLERQIISDQSQAEAARTRLLQLVAISAAIQSTGQSKAEAQSRAEAAKIEGESAVKLAKLMAQTDHVNAESELSRVTAARDAELHFQRQKNKLKEHHNQKITDLESKKFRQMIDAVGRQTLIEIVRGGTDTDARLLQSLGLEATMITDGHTPVNLLGTAHKLVAQSLLGCD